MEYTGLNELRKKFLDFFESKKHTILSSAPLVPQGDKSLLLINSGMAPLKKYFLGVETPPNKRVATCQKCIRTPDIERVGKTSRHGTYFEMLGNFSFGDYFKKEAISWAWEFFTEVLKMPKEKLFCSVYLDDDDAYNIWTKKTEDIDICVPENHMVRLGKEDNFWEHGSGPCGPCSEIYFMRSDEKIPDFGNENEKTKWFTDMADNDKLVEIWNLVFSQFDSDGNGNYAEMPTKNIDTGMGLERLACVIQGVSNLFEVDTVKNIMLHICELSGTQYKENEKTDISLRVITDHIRSTVFMVGDGVIPSNEGRGYVLRRLLRRASRHGRLLGLTDIFLCKVAETVIKENEIAYPELREKEKYIKKIILTEEENFQKTVERGLELLSNELKNVKEILPGEVAFKLSDTFGFPIDLTIELAEEKNITVDLEKFNELVKLQRQTARADYDAKASSSWNSETLKLDFPATTFVGYETLQCQAKVLYADEHTVILDKTPFYAESGGQVGDMGCLFFGDVAGENYRIYAVSDTKKDNDGHFLHIIHSSFENKDNISTEKDGENVTKVEVDTKTGNIYILKAGDIVTAQVSRQRRISIIRNHTAAHILQAVLREVLGDHVHQAGQLVNDDICRFDFNHHQALTAAELEEIELRVNSVINNSYTVTTRELPFEDAKKEGAMALFGEKYGDFVRVVSIDIVEWDGEKFTKGFISKEFCGGTHVADTAMLGGFKIISENSVAAGIRRITALTGENILKDLKKYLDIVEKSAKIVKCPNPLELVEKVQNISDEMKQISKEIEKLHSQNVGSAVDELFKCAVERDDLLFLAKDMGNLNAESLKIFGEKLKDKSQKLVAVLAGESQFLCICGKDAIAKGHKAGDTVKKIAAITGGKGGGRPDLAMAGIGDRALVEKALKTL